MVVWPGNPWPQLAQGLCNVFAADVAGSEHFLGRASVWDFAGAFCFQAEARSGGFIHSYRAAESVVLMSQVRALEQQGQQLQSL